MIAVNQHWIVSPIKSNIHDLTHDHQRNVNLLRALHVDYHMPDPVRLKKILIPLGKILRNEGAGVILDMTRMSVTTASRLTR